MQVYQDYNLDEMVPHLTTSDKQLIQGFFYKIGNEKVIIPEPNLIVIYFSNAQGFLEAIITKRVELFDALKSSKLNLNDILNNMFSFYGCVVNFVSSLFDSLEAFINSKIPKDYIYRNPKRRSEKMDKYKIIRYMSFEDKIKLIFKEIFFDKNFVVAKTHLFENIMLLKKFRDDITHAKADIEQSVNYYDKLFTKALDFDYLSAIKSSKEFINFYENDLIEPCNCGLDH
jgi:hypothetical protein